jgi:hypothetical protein
MQRVSVTLLALASLARAAAAATPLAEPGDARTISAVASLAHWFAEQVRNDQLLLAEKLRKLDKKTYLDAIAARRAKALACVRGLPAELAAEIDPRDGPWAVVRAQTFSGNGPSWIRGGRVSIAEYLRRTNNGYFLLVDDKQKALGWLPMDPAAFFPRDRSKSAEEARRVFVSSAATFLHGVWWNPEGYCDLGKPGDEQCGVPRQDVVYVNDFLALVQGRMPLASGASPPTIRDPYPASFDVTPIDRVYVAQPELRLRLSIEWRDPNGREDQQSSAVIFAGEDAPTGTIGNANRRTTLEALRHLSASRERRP